MVDTGISEQDLTDAAEKALRGDRAGAVGALVATLSGAFTGHPILGAALGRGAEWFVGGVVDGATQRLLAAGQQYDDERSRTEALAHEIADGLSPVWAHATEELTAQSREQFLQTLRFVERNVASAEGQDALVQAVRELAQQVQKLAKDSATVVASQVKGPFRVFVSYSSRDVAYRDAFLAAAKRLEESGLVSVWFDAETPPGQPWAAHIREELDRARFVVALVSPDFLASPWCVNELGRAFELRDTRLVDVLPVVVRQSDWRRTALGAIQALPAGGAPIETRPDVEAAWNDVVAGLERVLMGRERVQPAFPTRDAFLQTCTEVLHPGHERLMLLAPWRGGLEELAQEVARRSHGDAVTTLRLPAHDAMPEGEFYAEVSGEPAVTDQHAFRRWLVRRSVGPRRHLVVLPYFGGPRALVKELGNVTRGLFEQLGTLSLLAVGLGPCARLRYEVDHFSLFSGIITEYDAGLDLAETRTLLARFGSDPVHAPSVRDATGGHPEWTALIAPAVRKGVLHGLDQHLSDRKVFPLLRERLMLHERDRQGSAHAARVLEKLLAGERVTRLSNAADDFAYPEVRLYYDGVVAERDGKTVFRCEAARIAAERALEVWRERS